MNQVRHPLRACKTGWMPALAISLSLPLAAFADEPSLTPVKPARPVTPAITTPGRPPIDPVSHRRLTEAERARLYDQLEQEVELL